MRIQFYDDPLEGPRPKEKVRFNQLGLFLHDDKQRVAVGFDITPFRERPSIQVIVTNEAGQEAASLNVIETLQPNFNLTMHVRDQNPGHRYRIQALLYYNSGDGSRMIVDQIFKTLDTSSPGVQ